MLVSEYLQLPGYSQIEEELFSRDESLELIKIYDMMNIEINDEEKIKNIKILLFKINTSIYKKRKIMCLVLFCILNTSFGYSLIQRIEKFRKIIFNKYEEFILLEQSDDQHFVDVLKSKKI